MEFIYFKSVIGIALVLALMVAFVNLMSIENAELQLYEYMKMRTK